MAKNQPQPFRQHLGILPLAPIQDRQMKVDYIVAVEPKCVEYRPSALYPGQNTAW